MGLAEIVKLYVIKAESGVLSVKLKDEPHLLKVYMERGEIVYVTLGTLKNEECFSRLKNAVPVEYFFLKGVTPPNRIEGGCTEKLIEALGLSSAEALKASTGLTVSPQDVQRLEADFIDLIGPIGKLIIDDLFSKIAYTRGNPMAQEDYKMLVDSLTKELPVSEQGKFSLKYKS